MLTRRNFIKQSSVAGLVLGTDGFNRLFSDNSFRYASGFIKLELDPSRPRLLYLSTDSLGAGQFNTNPLLDMGAASTAESSSTYFSKIKDNAISYYRDAERKDPPSWSIACSKKEWVVRTQGQGAGPFAITFSQKLNHCTVLGAISADKQVKFPCLLHFPGMGTFRIHCTDPAITLSYDADRTVEKPFVQISLAAASQEHPDISYRFESAAIYPGIENISNDPRFDGFRRNYINIFQLNPRLQVLANNSASDACAFTLFLYAEMARRTPELARGLTAMDLIRNSLDRYLNGMKGYGQVGYNPPDGWPSEYDSSDSAPSLIISACYYILDVKDKEWAIKNYAGIKAWATKMIATDRNNDGIIEYGYSGNADSWNDKKFKRPANWWDTIGFGHDDAYSNALAYRACTLLAEVAGGLNNNEDSLYFSSFAGKLKKNYFVNFHNEATGLIAGWKSEDGRLHDYYFTFINSIAVCYGLMNDEQSKSIMRILMDKMRTAGFTDFKLGLPGNLIPVRKEDYVPHVRRWGYGANEDGSDGFGIYENGGATGCYAYFTIKALYQSGMRKEADMILYPMLESFKENGFDGNCPGSDMTKDWKSWTGKCWGYEGFLVDNYLALLAVLDR